ncbi:hypothetical protein CSW98_14345 [Vibrio sp. HA2012]|nr:hypothetical protein CSW98_14345 [Vibrio sp. HA2012]
MKAAFLFGWITVFAWLRGKKNVVWPGDHTTGAKDTFACCRSGMVETTPLLEFIQEGFLRCADYRFTGPFYL